MYSDPYVAGVGLGGVLLASFLLTGRGIGASGAFSTIVATGSAMLFGASRTLGNPAMAPYLTDGVLSPLHDWLVLEVAGVLVGGFLSAWLAGRLGITLSSGPNVSRRKRIVVAVLGGVLMGFGAKLARGCTSGQALTGGALLSVGSWLFIGTCFFAGYVCAPLARRLWL
jgi:uncharacterized membrane protein YedE/YeeE